MRKLDFLTEYPRIYVFQQERNKTNFGGVLFLIFLIIMLIISLSYILDFALNEKFEIEYLSIRNQTLSRDMPILEASEDYNPTMEFDILVPIESFYDNFRVALFENKEYHIKNFDHILPLPIGIRYAYSFKSRVSNMQAYLVYYCGKDKSCTINEKADSINENTFFGFEFTTKFPTIQHQNSKKPINYEKKLLRVYQYNQLSEFFKSDNIFLKL